MYVRLQGTSYRSILGVGILGMWMLSALTSAVSAQVTQPFNQQIEALIVGQRGRFGTSVAVSETTVIVGAPGDTVAGPDAGSVHVFLRNKLSGTTFLTQNIRPAEVGPFDRFGEAIALSGNILVVGAKGDDSAAPNAGAAYVFRRFGVGSPFELTNKLQAPSAGISDCFGASVAVIGNVIAVGAPRADDTAFDAGAVYLYSFNFGANTASPVEMLLDPDGAAGDGFGTSVAVGPSSIAVGAARLDAPSGLQNTGGVVVYESMGSSTAPAWGKVQTLLPSTPTAYSNFGSALSMVPPRPGVIGTLVVGAPDAKHPQSMVSKGSVSVYSSDSPVDWSLDFTYGLDLPGSGNRLGASVAVHDGVALAGAPGRYPPASLERNIGSVDLLRDFPSGGWAVETTIDIPGAADGWYVGSGVALQSGFPLIGAPGADLAPGFDSEGTAWSVASTWAPFGDLLCAPAVKNSTGYSASLVAHGSDVAAAGDLTLEVAFMPLFSFAYALVSRDTSFSAGPGGSQGNICLTGQVGRLVDVFQQSGTDGSISIPVNLSAIPQPLGFVATVPGDTWWFQVWYRDANPTVTSNFTDAVGVLFR
jgi:hypothetical protein